MRHLANASLFDQRIPLPNELACCNKEAILYMYGRSQVTYI